MGIRLLSVLNAKQFLRRSSLPALDVPKGYCAVYVGEKNQKKRFVIPITYFNQPSFQNLLSQVQEEFGFDYPITGALTIPCKEEIFINATLG